MQSRSHGSIPLTRRYATENIMLELWHCVGVEDGQLENDVLPRNDDDDSNTTGLCHVPWAASRGSRSALASTSLTCHLSALANTNDHHCHSTSLNVTWSHCFRFGTVQMPIAVPSYRPSRNLFVECIVLLFALVLIVIVTVLLLYSGYLLLYFHPLIYKRVYSCIVTKSASVAAEKSFVRVDSIYCVALCSLLKTVACYLLFDWKINLIYTLRSLIMPA